MFLIEIAHPAGALSGEDRTALAQAIVSGLVGAEGKAAVEHVSEEVLGRARTMTHVAFRAMDGWTSGEGPISADAPLPLWVTVTVPEAWREELVRHTLGWIRRAVRRLDDGRGWQRTGGDLWINLVGVADGSIGFNGKPSTADDVLAYMSEDLRAALHEGRGAVPEGVLIDPICGMAVRPGPQAITLDHHGRTLGFCALSCRENYARLEGVAVPSR